MRNCCGGLNLFSPVQFCENSVPLFCRDLSFIGKVSVFIDHLALDDIKYLLGIYISTFMAFSFLTVHKVNAFFEVGDSINGISVIDLISSGIEDQELVKHFENIR